MYIHDKLFEICNNKIQLYQELIQNIMHEYNYCINNIIIAKKENNIIVTREVAHKILGLISYLDKTNELVYLCKRILLYDKQMTLFETYKPHVENLLEYNFSYVIY